MDTIIKTASDFRKQLESNLRAHSDITGENILRLRRKVAFDRLLARIFTQESSSFFLKGGYGMELRTVRARATKDMDLTYLKRTSSAKEPMSELILQELQMLARVDLNDHFVYQIGPPQSDIENAPYGGSRHHVLAIINNRLFVEFDLDVGGDFLIDQTEKVPGTNWLGFYEISAPIISMISIEQQFAEKLHAYTLPREQINTRTKDLIDLILLMNHKQRLPAAFHHALQRVFQARNTHPLPETLPEPPEIWKDLFFKISTECGIPQSLEIGFKKVVDFYHTIHPQVWAPRR